MKLNARMRPHEKPARPSKKQTIQEKPHSLFNNSFWQFVFSFIAVIAVVLVIVLVLSVQMG
jgi:hypothetical protein